MKCLAGWEGVRVTGEVREDMIMRDEFKLLKVPGFRESPEGSKSQCQGVNDLSISGFLIPT